MFRDQLTSDIDYIWENSGVVEDHYVQLISISIRKSIKEGISSRGGNLPIEGSLFTVVAMVFEVTKVNRSKGLFSSGKSEIFIKYVGEDKAEKEKLRKEQEERDKPNGEIRNGIYSQTLEERDCPKVRISLRASPATLEHFKSDKEEVKQLDFLSILFHSVLEDYYEYFKQFPNVGEVLMSPSRTLYFQIVKRYFMHPKFLEPSNFGRDDDLELKKQSKWPIGIVAKVEMCEKDPDILHSIIKKIGL